MAGVSKFDEMAAEATELSESVVPGSGDRVRSMMSEILGEALAAQAGAPGDFLARLDGMTARLPEDSPLRAMVEQARAAFVRSAEGGAG